MINALNLMNENVMEDHLKVEHNPEFSIQVYLKKQKYENKKIKFVNTFLIFLKDFLELFYLIDYQFY